MEIEIKRYTSADKDTWDLFVEKSKNGTFLLFRDFMDYHAERFVDHSIMFYLKGKLIALLPGHVQGSIFYSHQGLTYAGLILSIYTKASHVIAIFEKLRMYLQSMKICQLVYKTIPHIYHKQPSEEDLYALFKNNALLVSRAISSCIVLDNKIEYSKLRKRKINKINNCNLLIKKTDSFSKFWEILEFNLSRIYNVRPTHSVQEIQSLKSNFTNNILQFEIWDSNEILGGCTIFKTHTVSHLQYISATEKGKKQGCLDVLINNIILSECSNLKYFDFGISTENNGHYLNQGLISQKEGFGARAICYDTYRVNL